MFKISTSSISKTSGFSFEKNFLKYKSLAVHFATVHMKIWHVIFQWVFEASNYIRLFNFHLLNISTFKKYKILPERKEILKKYILTYLIFPHCLRNIFFSTRYNRYLITVTVFKYKFNILLKYVWKKCNIEQDKPYISTSKLDK